MDSLITEFNLYDAGIILLIVLSTLIAFFRGMVKSFFSLVMWVGAFAGAWFAFEPVQDLVAPKLQFRPLFEDLAIGIVLFVVVFIVAAVLCISISGSIHSKINPTIDRVLGFVFGGVRGILLATVVFFVCQLFFFKMELEPKWFFDAKTYPLFDDVKKSMLAYAPKDIQEKLSLDKTKLKKLSDSLYQEGAENDGTLSRPYRDILNTMLEALPEEDLDRLSERFVKEEDGGDEKDKKPSKPNVKADIRFFKEIVKSYKKNVESDEVTIDKQASPEQVEELEKALEEMSKEQETGYDKDNINQLDRLMDLFE